MPVSSSGITGSAFPEWRFPSYRNRRFPWPDRRCKTVRNTQTEQDLTFYENELVEIIDSSLDCIELHLSNISSFSSNTIQNISYIKSDVVDLVN